MYIFNDELVNYGFQENVYLAVVFLRLSTLCASNRISCVCQRRGENGIVTVTRKYRLGLRPLDVTAHTPGAE